MRALPYVLTDEIPEEPFPKRCTKCRWVYLNRTEWELLEYVGIQPFDGEPYDLELRNCVCGTSLSIRTEKRWTKRDAYEWQAESWREFQEER